MHQKKILKVLLILLITGGQLVCFGQIADSTYLSELKTELQKKWPENRTINLVFHGHSVPAGYFATPDVRTLDAYPHLVLKQLKALYPYAVINVITTAIGGENSLQGVKRFEGDVLTHKPDVLFLDYALNDRGIGLEVSKESMEIMIEAALEENIPVILMTPSPDMRVAVMAKGNELEQFSAMLRKLAAAYRIGLADSFAQFKLQLATGMNLKDYMSQANHPNEKGHELIANEIMKYFK
ncbi:MAG: GDSL-type esterase/lipase family protein [Mangrovibacterium sp.]|nr:GDSL-type esterase/lipase family protein [Mangrovibacterium sp.]